jgi:hypothetical protein
MKRISFLLRVSLLQAVNAYGAIVCSGSEVADTNAIADALGTACGSGGGGEVVIPPGTCLVNPNLRSLILCSNLTIRGTGRASVIKISATTGPYSTIFGALAQVSNVVIKDFRVDQNPSGNQVQPGNESQALHVINLPAVSGVPGVKGIAVSGMFFDPINAAHAIHAESTDDLWATITNNYFNFQRSPNASQYSNAAVYLEGSQQVVTGNTFLAALIQSAGTAVETHGGRSTISNNTTNYYASLGKVVPTSALITTALSPNDIVVSNNSVTCAQNAILLAGVAGRTIQNVSITGNTIHVCNNDRWAQTNPTIFAGIRYDWTTPGDVDSLVVSNNVVAMQPQTSGSYSTGSVQHNGGIVLYTQGNLANVLVTGNIVTNSPISGIRVGSSSTVPIPVQRVRVTENIVVDAGNDGLITSANADFVYRHAIGLWGYAKEVDVMRNMIYDTRNDTAFPLGTFGYYALYLNQTSNPASTNIRTSQNTVRINAPGVPGQPALLPTFEAPNAGLVDATNANDVLISSIPVFASGATLNVDFMSFTRYITTITGNSGSQLTLTVPSPAVDSGGNPPSYLQWTVGQLVTFRFSCGNLNQQGGCLVKFDPQTYPNISAYSMNGDLDMTSGTGRAITFQVESFVGAPNTRRFFELYRTPVGVPNS